MDHGLPAEVLDPLGLDRTSYHPAPPHASGWAVHPWADAVLPEAGRGLRADGPGRAAVVDHHRPGRFGTFLLHGDDRVLPAAVVEEKRAPSSPPEPGDPLHGQGPGLQLLRPRHP